MGLRITMAGVDIAHPYCDEFSLKITDTLGQGAGAGGGSAGRASTCSFRTTLGPVASAVGAGTRITTPQLVRQGEVIVYDALGNKIFGGYVGKLTDKTDKTQVYTDVECYDYYQELDRYQVQQIYSGATDVYMIRDILTKYAPWVDLSLLPTAGTYTFTAKVFKAITVQKVISTITDVTGYMFWIDPYRRAHYVSPNQASTAPFSLSTAPNFTSTFPHAIDDYQTDDTAAINRVTFYGGKKLSANFTQDLSTQANGSNRTFVLAYYPRPTNVNTFPFVANGNTLTVGYLSGNQPSDTYVSQGGTANALLNADAHVIVIDPAYAAPTNTGPNSVTFTYRFEYPMSIQITDQSSYSFYGQYFDGVISDSTIFDTATAVGRCRTLLTEQSRGLTTGKAHCYKAGLQSGQILAIVNAVRGINASFIVQEVDTVPLGNGQFRYDITFGAWNWNLIDVITSALHAAFQAGVTNVVDTATDSTNAIEIEQANSNVGVHDAWTKVIHTTGQFYARATAVGDGHDAYPGLCTISS